MMKPALIVSAAALCVLTTPAWAVLQLAIDVDGTVFTCADNESSCDMSSTPGVLELKTLSVGGVEITGKFVQSSTNPDTLSVSSSSILNTTSSSVHYKAVFSDTDFVAPISSIFWSGSGTWLGAEGSSFTDRYYADAANGQGGGAGLLTPGTQIASWGGNVTMPSQSFSDNGTTPFTATGPYSMTMEWDATFAPGAQVVSRGQALFAAVTPIPEASTWALLGIGFALLGGVGWRKRRDALAIG